MSYTFRPLETLHRVRGNTSLRSRYHADAGRPTPQKSSACQSPQVPRTLRAQPHKLLGIIELRVVNPSLSAPSRTQISPFLFLSADNKPYQELELSDSQQNATHVNSQARIASPELQPYDTFVWTGSSWARQSREFLHTTNRLSVISSVSSDLQFTTHNGKWARTVAQEAETLPELMLHTDGIYVKEAWWGTYGLNRLYKWSVSVAHAIDEYFGKKEKVVEKEGPWFLVKYEARKIENHFREVLGKQMKPRIKGKDDKSGFKVFDPKGNEIKLPYTP